MSATESKNCAASSGTNLSETSNPGPRQYSSIMERCWNPKAAHLLKARYIVPVRQPISPYGRLALWRPIGIVKQSTSGHVPSVPCSADEQQQQPHSAAEPQTR